MKIKSEVISDVYDESEGEFYDEPFGVLYNKAKTKLVKAPSDITEYSVLSSTKVICDRAFEDCKLLSHIVLPVGLEYIGISAFLGCEKLTSLQLPDSVKSLGFFFVFAGMKSLTTIQFSKGLTSIPATAFHECNNLTDIVIPENITTIEPRAFYKCESLETISIPDSLTEIKNGAFAGCAAIKEFKLSKNHPVFRWKNGILINKSKNKLLYYSPLKTEKHYKAPKYITEIDDMAFGLCSHLETVYLPDSVTVLESGAFARCVNLKSIRLSKKLKTINDQTFRHCESLTSIVIPKSVEYIGSLAFENCFELREVVIRNPDATFGRNLFAGCENLND